MVTKAFLLLNVLSIVFNLNVGFALAFAKWENIYHNLGLFSLACWGLVFILQLRLFQRYVVQYFADKKCDLSEKEAYLARHSIGTLRAKLLMFLCTIIFLIIFIKIWHIFF